MTTYYISPSGSDSNNGLGPDASDATNKPWLTLRKALAAGSAVVPGDIVYMAPGFYSDTAQIAVSASIASSGSPTQIIGDPTNAQGFKDGSGVRLAPGLVWHTPRTSSELDSDSASLIDAFLLTGVAGLQFKYLYLEAPQQSIFLCNAATTADLLVEDCRLVGDVAIQITGATTAANRNLTVRRCLMLTHNALFASYPNAAAAADVDVNVLFESNLLFGRFGGSIGLGTAGGNIAGGITFKRNTVLGAGSSTVQTLVTAADRVSTVVPIRLEGNLIMTGEVVVAGTAGQVVSDGNNRYWATQNHDANFTPHASDVLRSSLHLVLPDLVKYGLGLPREDWFGWTSDAPAAQRASGSNTNPDWRNQQPRPWGAGPSIGAWECLDITQDTGAQISGGGANSLKLTGAGEFAAFVKVNASATTLTIKTKSSSYGGTNYPQFILVANPTIGVSQATATATDASEQTLTIGPFTPTAAGVVELRLISRSSSTTSATYFDVLAAS